MSEFLSLFSDALIAGALLSLLIAIAGSLMLLGRYSYTAAAIAHGSYGGVGIAMWLGVPVLASTTIFALILALALAYITYKNPHRSDLLIGTIWAVGMSLGIIFVDLAPGYNTDLFAYLFGNILLVAKEDIYYLLFVDILLVAALLRYYNLFLAVAYDPDFAKVRRIPVRFIHTLTLVLLALAIVASIRAVGLILVIALLSIPPFIAERLSRTFGAMILISALLAMLFIMVGLAISYRLDISATASIILVATLGFILFSRSKR